METLGYLYFACGQFVEENESITRIEISFCRTTFVTYIIKMSNNGFSDMPLNLLQCHKELGPKI